MTDIGINIKRMVITIVLGALAGLMCAYGTSTAPVPKEYLTMEFLVWVWYNRFILGFVLGIADHIRLLNNDIGNSAVRGAIIGAIISILMIIIPGVAAISYLFAGIVFGLLIDIIATKLAPTE
ncbi:MAG: hypothetical protein ACFFAO_01485 [Candidatus Hermodarchaeota archaeon]